MEPETLAETAPTIALTVWREWKFCGCGNPETVLSMVKDCLRATRDRWDVVRQYDDWNDLCSAAMDTERAKYPSDEASALMVRYLMASNDLTEHGGSVFGAWLSDKGFELLEFLEKTPEDNWMEE